MSQAGPKKEERARIRDIAEQAMESVNSIEAYGGGEKAVTLNGKDRKPPLMLTPHLKQMLVSNNGKLAALVNAALVKAAIAGDMLAQRILRDRVDGPVMREAGISGPSTNIAILVGGQVEKPLLPSELPGVRVIVSGDQGDRPDLPGQS